MYFKDHWSVIDADYEEWFGTEHKYDHDVITYTI